MSAWRPGAWAPGAWQGTAWGESDDDGIVAAGIASAEAFGSPSLAAVIASAGIASAEAIGAPVVAARVASTGIATAEAFGTPSLAAAIAPSGVASAEAIGLPIVAAQIASSGIPTAEAFGDAIVGDVPEHPIDCIGIPSAEAFGLCTVGTPAGRTEQLGGGARRPRRPRVREPLVVVLPPHAIHPAGIPSAEAFGMPRIGAAIAPRSVVGPGSQVGAPRVRRIPTPLQLMDEMMWLGR